MHSSNRMEVSTRSAPRSACRAGKPRGAPAQSFRRLKPLFLRIGDGEMSHPDGVCRERRLAGDARRGYRDTEQRELEAVVTLVFVEDIAGEIPPLRAKFRMARMVGRKDEGARGHSTRKPVIPAVGRREIADARQPGRRRGLRY